jgi:hypothetical protein
MQDLTVKITINGADHGVNDFGANQFGGVMFSDAYYSVASQYGDDFHGDMCQRVAALILKGHHQGGFLLGSGNEAVDFYAYNEGE